MVMYAIMNQLLIHVFLSLCVTCGTGLVIPSGTHSYNIRQAKDPHLHAERTLSDQQLQEHHDKASPVQLLTLFSDLMSGVKEPRIIAATKNQIGIPMGASDLVASVGSILASVLFALVVWAIFVAFIADPPESVNRNDNVRKQNMLNLITDTVLGGIKQQDDKNHLMGSRPYKPFQPENKMQDFPNVEVAPNLPNHLRPGRPFNRRKLVNQAPKETLIPQERRPISPQDRRPTSKSQPIFKTGNQNRVMFERDGQIRRRIGPNSGFRRFNKPKQRTSSRSPHKSYLPVKQNINQDISSNTGIKKHLDREDHGLQQLLLNPKNSKEEESEVTYYFEVPGGSQRPPKPRFRRPYWSPENDVKYFYERPPKFLNPVPNRWRDSTPPLKNKRKESNEVIGNSHPIHQIISERIDNIDNIEYVDSPKHSVLNDYEFLDDYKDEEYSDNEITQDFYPTTMDPDRLHEDNDEFNLKENADPFDKVNYSFFPFSDEVPMTWVPDDVQTDDNNENKIAIKSETNNDKEILD